MLKVVYNTKSILLPGDIQGVSLQDIVRIYPIEYPKIEIVGNTLRIEFREKRFSGGKYKDQLLLESRFDAFYELMEKRYTKVKYEGSTATSDAVVGKISSNPLPMQDDMNELVRYLSLTADALRLPHHRSCDGYNCKTTRDFIKAVQPRIIFSSSGLQGGFGHPRCEITTPPIVGVKLGAMSPHCYTCYKKGGKDHPIFTIKESRAILSTVTCDTEKGTVHQNTHIIKLTIDSIPKISAALQLYTAHSSLSSDIQCRKL